MKEYNKLNVIQSFLRCLTLDNYKVLIVVDRRQQVNVFNIIGEIVKIGKFNNFVRLTRINYYDFQVSFYNGSYIRVMLKDKEKMRGFKVNLVITDDLFSDFKYIEVL